MTSYLTNEQGQKIAYQHLPGEGPGVLFFCGFRSDMASTKAMALYDWCKSHGAAFTRFDYRAHGRSEGDFREFSIGGAIRDALLVIDQVTAGPQVMVGSSMGGWIALQAALERKMQVKGLIGIAAAPDFTERLMFQKMTAAHRREMEENGEVMVYSDYTSNDYPVTRRFLDEARNHLMLDDVIPLEKPVHLLHGMKDIDVPYELSAILSKQLLSEDVVVSLIKTGDHRLNRPEDLELLMDTVNRMRAAD